MVGLCGSSFLLLEYSIEYSSTRWIEEVAINHRVVQNKRTWFLIQVCSITTVRNESKSLHKILKNKPKDLTKHYYSSENITDCYNLLVNRHRKFA